MTQPGLDLLALAMMDEKLVAKSLHTGCQSLGSLRGTFGPIDKKLIFILTKCKQVKSVRNHLANGSCIRMNRCAPGEPSYTSINTLIARTKADESLALKFPNLKFYTSPFVEHGCKDKGLVREWYEIIHQYAPHCTPVCSSVGGFIPDHIMVENHGNEAKGDIISNDGESIYDTNGKVWASRGKVLSLGWDYIFNLNKKGGAFVYPTQRKLRPTAQDFNNVQIAMGI